LNFDGYKAQIISNNPSARFGRELTWLSNGDLLVAAPQHSSKSWYVPHDMGRLYLYEEAHNLSGTLD